MSAILQPRDGAWLQATEHADGDAGVWRPEWARADDQQLLAHFAGPRGIRFDAEVDAQEIAPSRIEGILHGRFEFNGETHALGMAPDWLHNPSGDVEWHILLHKFYFAVGLAQHWLRTRDAIWARRWQELLNSWIDVTPPGFIAADVTGRRVQHWIYSLQGLVFERTAATGPTPVQGWLLRRVLLSLHEQVEYLVANLTAKRNHRTLELAAIFLAGVALPEFQRAARWRQFALDEIVRNIEADLQADGVHCEQSTDYHHLALRNWLHVRELAVNHGMPVPTVMDRLLLKACEFALHVHRPDGDVPSFSDGDVRSYRPLLLRAANVFAREDFRFAATLGQEGHPSARRNAHFDASGYHVLRSGWGTSQAYAEAQQLVFDCGPLGEGNHGHFDALSFELSAYGRPLLVDPGRYTYSEMAGDDGVNWRVHFRGTAAHNTVCVDGLNQTAYAPRKVKDASRHAVGSVRHKISGPAPDVKLLEGVDGEAVDLLHGRCVSHAYDAVHERCVAFVGRRYWIVTDWLQAPTEHHYVLQHQLGAEAQGDVRLFRDAARVRFEAPHLTMAQPCRPGHRHLCRDGWVSRSYGHKHKAPRFETHVCGRDVRFDTVLFPWRHAPIHLRVTDRPVRGESDSTGYALRIEWEEGADTVTEGWFHAQGRGDGPWCIDDLCLHGRWLHWREDAQGRVLCAHSHQGARLHSHGRVVDLAQGGSS